VSEIPLQDFLAEWRADCLESDHTIEGFRMGILLSLPFWLALGAIIWFIF
jgi:hypothetical protein